MKGFVSSRLHPLANLALLLVLLVATACLSMLLIAIASNLLYGVGLTALGNVQQQPGNYANGWEISMLSQGLLLLGGFGGQPWRWPSSRATSCPTTLRPAAACRWAGCCWRPR